MIPVLDLQIASGPPSAVLMDRFLDLTITDEPGLSADTLEMAFDDRNGDIVLPAKDVEIRVGLGYGTATLVGVFGVDVIGASLSPQQITIRAKAVSMTAGLKEPKTRSWTNTTLGAVMTEIAADHGLVPAIASGLAAQPYETVSQIAESDANLISRLAKRHGAIGKPKDGLLVFHDRGKISDARAAVPVVALTEPDFTTLNWTSENRPAFSRVTAWYRDFDAGTRKRISIGSGSPSITLRETFVNEATARSAAEARINASARLLGTLSGKLARGNASLRGEGRIDLSGFKPEIDGLWSLTRVVHRYSKGGFETNFEAEVALK